MIRFVCGMTFWRYSAPNGESFTKLETQSMLSYLKMLSIKLDLVIGFVRMNVLAAPIVSAICRAVFVFPEFRFK